MSARVDKQWKDKGLTGYSTEAILGTLGHYGVQLDEAGFKAAAENRFPLELAIDWKPKWKGTGQFAPYPYAAASELYTRLLPEKPSPMKTAHVVLDLIANALREVAGKPEAAFATAYKGWEELVPKFPAKGERRDAFLREFVSFIESWAQTFNELPERLAKAGKKEAALQFASVHEVLFTDREGCMTAIVRAQTGDRDAAVADLKKWGADESREVYQRYSALDALFQLEEFAACKELGIPLFDAVAKEKKWDLADTVAHLLGHLVQKVGADAAYMRQVRDRLDLAHQHTGGHHH
ncbi:MAG TPA: hypothetical protein VGE37_07480 [Archangium sp.]